MASNPIMDLQMAIRRNAEDLRDELADLERWEDEVATKEAARKKRAPVEADLPPIRGTVRPAGETKKPKEDPVQTAKDQGNEYFRQCKYEDAVRAYTKGINYDPDSSSTHILYANRAMCYLKLQIWDLAEKDATTCIQMNRTYTKAFYRRALARKAMGKLRDARADLEIVLVLSPGDQDGEKELKNVTAELVAQDKATAAAAGPSAAAPKKKKLVIQEVDDEDDEAAPRVSSSVDANKAEQETRRLAREEADRAEAERVERQRRDHEAARAAEEERAKERRRQAEAEELKRRQTRRTNARVEVVESDDDDAAFQQATAKPTPAARHTDPAPRKVTTEMSAAALAPPRSFIEFENTYADIMKKQPALLGTYLQLIPADRWKPVFGSSMTPEILADVAKAALSMDAAASVNVLLGVASVPRIAEVVMFMDDKDVTTIKSALDRAVKQARAGDADVLKRFLASL